MRSFTKKCAEHEENKKKGKKELIIREIRENL